MCADGLAGGVVSMPNQMQGVYGEEDFFVGDRLLAAEGARGCRRRRDGSAVMGAAGNGGGGLARLVCSGSQRGEFATGAGDGGGILTAAVNSGVAGGGAARELVRTRGQPRAPDSAIGDLAWLTESRLVEAGTTGAGAAPSTTTHDATAFADYAHDTRAGGALGMRNGEAEAARRTHRRPPHPPEPGAGTTPRRQPTFGGYIGVRVGEANHPGPDAFSETLMAQLRPMLEQLIREIVAAAIKEMFGNGAEMGKGKAADKGTHRSPQKEKRAAKAAAAKAHPTVAAAARPVASPPGRHVFWRHRGPQQGARRAPGELIRGLRRKQEEREAAARHTTISRPPRRRLPVTGGRPRLPRTTRWTTGPSTPTRRSAPTGSFDPRIGTRPSSTSTTSPERSRTR